jgi:hypothetical protein
MPLFDAVCDECGWRGELLLLDMPPDEARCVCGALVRRLPGAPRIVVKTDEVNPNPVERAKREAEMNVMIPRRQFVRKRMRERAGL